MYPSEVGPRLRQACRRSFPPHPPDPGRTVVELFDPAHPGAVDLDRFEVLGTVVDARSRRRWDRDPATGQRWPSGADPLTAGLDPKPLWELGRLQHLALAAAAGDPRAAAEAGQFLEANPMGSGLHWASSLEVAVRLVSLARIAATAPARPLVQAIAAHAAWIEAFASVGSSARNHRVAELAALAVAAHTLPHSPGARRWRRQAAGLASALGRQIHPDGSGIEQSSTYLAFVVEWGLVARRAGVQGLDGALVRATEYLATLVDRSGSALSIGDSDDGRVLAPGLGPEKGYLASVAGCAAAILGLAPPAPWRPDLRSRWLGAPSVRPSRSRPSRTFPHGGLTILRDRRSLVGIDHGPVGEPDLAAHGHADALSVWIHLADGPAIVGRGTGRYNADPDQRRFARGTTAHPTVVVAGADQSEPHAHPFLWRSRARATAEEVDVARKLVVASHDGYRRLGVIHRRRVEVTGDRIEILDTLEGAGRRHVAVIWPLDPSLRIRSAPHRVDVFRHHRVMALLADARCTIRSITGGARPGPGWHSPGYGRWVEATTVIFEARPRLPTTLRTVIHLDPDGGGVGG